MSVISLDVFRKSEIAGLKSSVMKMNSIWRRLWILAAFVLAVYGVSAQAAKKETRSNGRVVAYVTSWGGVVPDPFAMTNINYAFGHVNDTFDGVKIDNPERLRRIAQLKKDNPNLEVQLSIGGWGSGNFSEMAADPKLRKKFAKDCRCVMDEYGLDGIDIDWEYPTSSAAGISASPDDTDNFTLLMKDLRKALPKKALLTMASISSAAFVDFPAIMKYLDFVNIMAYDMASPPKHHSPLYSSPTLGQHSAESAVTAHLNGGVPASKLVLGLPFYGRGTGPYSNFTDYRRLKVAEGCTECWDSIACAPYIAASDGKLVLGYDNPRSIALKCDFIKGKGLLGVMYWDYGGDNEAGELRKAVAEEILQ